MNDPTNALTVLGIEQGLRAAVPEAVFASPRVVRRIIRADLDLPLLVARVPHRESIALSPARMLELADDVWALPERCPETILLVARPDPAPLTAGDSVGLLREYWRRLYHGCLDIAARHCLATHAAAGEDFARLVHDVGETAFDEARSVLVQEGRVREGDGTRTVLAEFIAVFLEFVTFAPDLLPVWFPALEDGQGLRDRLASLVDAPAILSRTRPEGLATHGSQPPAIDTAEPSTSAAQPIGAPRPVGRLTAAALRSRAAAAARRGNDVRAALLLWRFRADDADTGASFERRVVALARRLERAVGLDGVASETTRTIVRGLLDRAAGSAWSQPARLLYDLQRACVDSERESYRTRLLAWAFSLGRVPLIRPLPSQRVALVHRHLAAAFRRLKALDPADTLRRDATDLLMAGLAATESIVRDRLGPEVRRAVTGAGLVPTTLVEEAALDTLVDELLDGVVSRGFESFGALRDAVSRNQVKLADLSGIGELLGGDALLRADRQLATVLDGAYRQAPFYLLAMQRLSAVAFGLPLGRAITLHLLLPFGGAWLLWKGLEHVVEPLTAYSFGEPVHISSRPAVLATGALIWVLVHLPQVRSSTVEALRAVGTLLVHVCIELPRRLLRLAWVDAVLRSRPVRLFRRYAWSPLVLTAIVWLLLPHGDAVVSRGDPWLPVAVFAASAAILNAPVGRLVQERVLEGVGRVLHQLHAHLVVGLIGWIVDLFRRAIDVVEGTLYAVDEQLRFRSDESRLALAVKAVLTTLWAAVDWVVRFCVTLLIEPQLNPIKHFPVVTVSHKLLVPMIPMVAGNLAAATGMERGLALTTVTFVSATTPGVFGFLAWELKENWRLYAANRPRLLMPVLVGRHGETMRRLLMPGFHSGTIPKLFARMRRQARGADGTPVRRGTGRVEEQLVELTHDIAAFVDDECLGLLRRTRPMRDVVIRVADVRLATNRVAIDLAADGIDPRPLRLELVQGGGSLSSHVADPGWLGVLPDDRRQIVSLALAGFDRLCGADFVTEEIDGVSTSRPVARLEWAAWRDAWERERLPEHGAAHG